MAGCTGQMSWRVLQCQCMYCRWNMLWHYALWVSEGDAGPAGTGLAWARQGGGEGVRLCAAPACVGQRTLCWLAAANDAAAARAACTGRGCACLCGDRAGQHMLCCCCCCCSAPPAAAASLGGDDGCTGKLHWVHSRFLGAGVQLMPDRLPRHACCCIRRCRHAAAIRAGPHLVPPSGHVDLLHGTEREHDFHTYSRRQQSSSVLPSPAACKRHIRFDTA